MMESTEMEEPKSKEMCDISQLESFEGKIKEAISLVRSMSTEDKLKAVQYWNAVSENLQDIVNSSADDISALASQLSERERFMTREQLKLTRPQLPHSVPVAHNAAHFLGAPEVLPQLSVNQNVKVLHASHLDTPATLFSLEDKQGDGSVMSSDLLDQYLTGNHNVATSAHEEQDQSSLHVIVDDCDAFGSNVGLEEHVHSSGPLDSLVSRPGVNSDMQGETGTNPTLAAHRIIVDDQFHSASPHHLGDEDDPLPLPNIHLSDAETRELGVEDLDMSLPDPCANSSSTNGDLTSEERDELANLEDLEKYLTVAKNGKGITVLNFFTKQTVPSDVQGNPKIEYTCNVCKKLFVSIRSFYIHFAEHTKPITCTVCDAIFTTRNERKKHMDLQHDTAKKTPPADGAKTAQAPVRQKRTEKRTDVIKCDECGRQCSTMSNLTRHMRTHTGDRPFQCATCGKRFSEKKSLQTHERLHTGERPYRCTVCPSRFPQLSNLNEHMEMHSNTKRHLCELCGKSFRQPAQLKAHRLRHEGKKSYQCDKCPLAFNVFNDLKRHRHSHLEEKPLKCNQCSRSFSRQQALAEHMNRHFGTKPYQCPLCTKSYADLSACHKHIKRVHKCKPKSSPKPGDALSEMDEPGNAEALFVVSDVSV